MMGVRCADAIEAVRYLQRRITEQVGQEPRQKYVGGHQLIHDRKKNDVCVPILRGHDQEAWFAKLDSNGIWGRVFQFLSDPSDVTSAYFACETFRKHLEEKRKMMLVPKVFEVLRDTGHLHYSGFGGTKSNDPESRQVLQQRLVSKAWKKWAEDAYLLPVEVTQNRIPEMRFSWSNWDWMVNRSKMVCRFRDVRDVEKAIAKLQNPNSCASLVRLVLVYDSDCDDKDSFYSKLADFLDVHGESVWCFSYFQDKPLPSNEFNYDGLRSVLAKMPNLKALKILADWIDKDFGGSARDRMEFENCKEKLRLSIARNPLPDLSALEYLNIFSYPAQYECFVSEFLTKAPNVKAVILSDWDRFDSENVIPQVVWDALEKLRLEIFEFNYKSLGNLCVDDFLRLGQFDWPLKYLSVGFRIPEEEDIILHASKVFEVLNKFSDTLVEFHFDVDGLWLVNDRKSVVVDFPNLKNFDVDIDDLLLD